MSEQPLTNDEFAEAVFNIGQNGQVTDEALFETGFALISTAMFAAGRTGDQAAIQSAVIQGTLTLDLLCKYLQELRLKVRKEDDVPVSDT
jgi:hypothetical protein